MKPLSFNDWLETWEDEIPEEVDLYDAYNSYVESVEEMALDNQLV
ncbi:hypothetical protein PODOV006v2_p0016 [Vibrio phage 15E36.1]|uniref:Uncharacterized protein n=1 Tax=Vibrio phage 15E36.1 TaxID=2859290 RepID=A0AAE8C503_9CAUD|nr:hypothetical protein PODOV006v2_p0016 [Vibrio phage 15E36.1]